MLLNPVLKSGVWMKTAFRYALVIIAAKTNKAAGLSNKMPTATYMFVHMIPSERYFKMFYSYQFSGLITLTCSPQV